SSRWTRRSVPPTPPASSIGAASITSCRFRTSRHPSKPLRQMRPDCTTARWWPLDPALLPFLRELVQSGTLEILRRHGGEKLDGRVEVEEPGLGKARDLGSVGHIDDQESAPLSVFGAEVDCLGLGILEDSVELLAGSPIADGLVELVDR